MNNRQATIEEIKQAFIKACLTSDATHFAPFLYSDKFVCDGEKKGFYKILKMMLVNSRAQSVGELTLRIENTNYAGRNVHQYCFYDAVHKFARLSVNVEESENTVSFDILPF